MYTPSMLTVIGPGFFLKISGTVDHLSLNYTVYCITQQY